MRSKLKALYVPLVLALSLTQGCGPEVSKVIPTLPGEGTDNLVQAPSEAKEAPPAEVDPWEGRELITAPKAKAPAAIPLPAIERFTLKNGLQVIAVHDESLPVTNMQVAVKAGTRQAQREKIGLAEFTAETMTRGTRLRTAARIARDIEAIGGSLQANASYEATLVSCKSLSKDLGTCMKLLPDVLSSPTFPKSEIELVRRNMHAGVRQRLDDASQLASAHFKSALWGDEHPRGWVTSPSTIDAISREDLVGWHKQWVRPNNAVLAISGSFDAARLRAQLERSFRRWRKAEVPQTAPVVAPKLRGLQIRLVDKPGQTQSHIRLGHKGIAHGDPDFYATLVFNHALGGGQFASRLMKVVRSAEGKAYTASSAFDRNREVGAFVAATFTRSAETVATVKLMRQVVASMAEEGPTDEERTAAVTNLAGSHATRFETAGDIASAVLAADLHGFTEEYVSQYPLNLAKVTTAQAAQAAGRVLDPVNAVLVIVGDARRVGPQLEATGWSYQRVAHTDPISNWERKAQQEAGNQADDPEKLAAARELLDQALEAKGGAKRLVALQSFRWVGDARLNLPTGPVPASVEKRFARGGKLRLDMSIGGGKVKIATVLNGKTGWAREESPRGKQVQAFSAPELAALRTQLWRDPELVLLRHQESGATLKALGKKNVDGTAVQAISVIGPSGQPTVTLLVDPRSKLLIGMDYADQGMNTSERYAEYKKVGGLQVAHRRSTKGPQVDLSVSIKSFEVNKAMPDAVFVQPPATVGSQPDQPGQP